MKNEIKKYLLIFLVSLLLMVSCERSFYPVGDSINWILQRDKQDNITYYSIFFSNQDNGWIVGYSGTIKNTTNGGNNWNDQQSGVSSNFWEVCFVDNLKGWVCGEKNTILKTIDGGKSWINISPSSPQNKIYVSIKFIDGNNGWTSNNNGEILKTTNGGTSWEMKKKFNIGGGSKLSVFSYNVIYIFHGNLYKTNNSGNTWDSIAISIPKNYAASDIFFSDINHGWITTENGTGGQIITEYPIMITNDGGKTWSSSELVNDGGINCVYFTNNDIGWIAGVQNIYKSDDGGKHWRLELFSKNYILGAKDIFFINENYGWMLTWDGVIYNYYNP
jgi:photosystem II stability/assembly factor-like uncharacterized protein